MLQHVFNDPRLCGKSAFSLNQRAQPLMKHSAALDFSTFSSGFVRSCVCCLISFVCPLTTNENEAAVHLAVHAWSCGQCFLCDCRGVGFLQNALEVGSPILLCSGAGAVGKPLRSDSQYFGIIVGVRNIRVFPVLSRTFVSRGERSRTRYLGVDDFALSFSVLPAVSEAA
jgi:hypothetical protein